MTLQERLRQEAALCLNGHRACLPGLLHEAAKSVESMERELVKLRAKNIAHRQQLRRLNGYVAMFWGGVKFSQWSHREQDKKASESRRESP